MTNAATAAFLLLVLARTGAPLWGHVVSQDLVRWSWLPPALLPDQPYDRGGVWSGSATIDNEGTVRRHGCNALFKAANCM
jgi:hypothetical protein